MIENAARCRRERLRVDLKSRLIQEIHPYTIIFHNHMQVNKNIIYMPQNIFTYSIIYDISKFAMNIKERSKNAYCLLPKGDTLNAER